MTVNRKIAAMKFNAGEVTETVESVAREEALQITINLKPYTITMRTPGSDVLLATGLLFTENIVNHPTDIISTTEVPAPNSDHTLVVALMIKEEVLQGKNLFNRSIASSASCGVCGKTELCDLPIAREPLYTADKLNVRIIPCLLQQMSAAQRVFEQTGGSHAAAAFTIRGNLLSVQEDIGRHNAVDKVIGDLFLSDALQQAALLFVSGRVSYEIVAKCARAGIPFLLAVSAPSSLAVEFSRQQGITLIGFCRDNRCTVYTHEQNVVQYASTSLTTTTNE
jgi:FdhD protein